MADSPNLMTYALGALNPEIGYQVGMHNVRRVVSPVINTSLAENDFKDANGRYPNSAQERDAWIKQQGQVERDRRAANQAPPNAPQQPQPPVPTNDGSYGPQPATGALAAPEQAVKAQLPTGPATPVSAQDAAAQQRGALSVANQNVGHQQLEAQKNGYVAPPKPGDDPVGNLAARNNNKSAGVGGVSGEINFGKESPQAPTVQQMQNMALDQTGKKAAFNMDDMPQWYESQSFNYGLISFGLNLLSGNDLATSFAAAGSAFSDMYGQERRQTWAQDLISQGYTPTEVEEYIRTGKSDVLTDPMKKQAQQIQMQTNLQQLNNLEYEGSPEMRQYKLDQDAFDRNIKVEQLQDSRAARAESAALRREQMAASAEEREIRRQERADKAAAKGAEYKENLSKAENWYTRARQGYKNYENTVKNYGGVDNIYSNNAFGQMTQGAMTDLIFSGSTTKEVAAKKLDEKFVTTVNREREFLAPLLRKDSGAAISQGEWKTTGEIYFPRPGDTKESIEQKAQSRVVAMLATNPHASGELRNVVDQYTIGNVKALKERGGKVYAQSPQGQWFEVPQ